MQESFFHKLAESEGDPAVKCYAEVKLQSYDLLLKNIAAKLKEEGLISK